MTKANIQNFFIAFAILLLLPACSTETIAEKTLTENEWGGEISPIPNFYASEYERSAVRFSKTNGLEIICYQKSTRHGIAHPKYHHTGPIVFKIKNNAIYLKDVEELPICLGSFDKILYEINGDELILAFFYKRSVWEVDFRGPLVEIFMLVASPFVEMDRYKIKNSGAVRLKKLPNGSFEALRKEFEK